MTHPVGNMVARRPSLQFRPPSAFMEAGTIPQVVLGSKSILVPRAKDRGVSEAASQGRLDVNIGASPWFFGAVVPFAVDGGCWSAEGTAGVDHRLEYGQQWSLAPVCFVPSGQRLFPVRRDVRRWHI